MSGLEQENGSIVNQKVLLAVLGLFVLVVVAYVVYNYYLTQQLQNFIKASGSIETVPIEVGSRVGGRIHALQAQEGDTVSSGQLIMVLDPYTVPAKELQIHGQLAQAHAALDQLLNGARPQELAAAQALYQSAQAQASLVAEGPRKEDIEQAIANRREAQAAFDNAKKRYERFDQLLQKHVIAQQEFDDVYRAYLQVKEQLTVAQQREAELIRGSRPQEIATAQQQARAQKANYDLLKAGARAEQIEAQRALIGQLEGQLAELETTAAELLVKSPCRCELNGLPVKPGQLILPNQTVATLLDLNDLWIRVYIPEERFGQVKPGDVALVKVDAYPNKTFKGRVVQVSDEAEFTPRNVQTQETRKILVFGVKVTLDNQEGLLRPGMPADVTFDVRHMHSKAPASAHHAPDSKDS